MTWKYTYPALAALVAGIWLIGPLQAADQTPPWQEPPTSESFGAWASQSGSAGGPACSATPGCKCGNTCGPAGPCGACDDGDCTGNLIFGPCCGFTLPHDDWVRLDALLWWTKGAAIPPLLTTSPDSTPQAQAGVLGQSTTTILLGNQELNKDFRAGYRISFGTWLDESDSLGIEFSYLGLGQSVDRTRHDQHGKPHSGAALFQCRHRGRGRSFDCLSRRTARVVFLHVDEQLPGCRIPDAVGAGPSPRLPDRTAGRLSFPTTDR